MPHANGSVGSARPALSKSKYTAGLQCERRVWLQVHERALATPVDAAQQAIFDTGNEVGRCAHHLFPGGVLVDQAAWQHAQALARTQELLANPRVPAIFEAAFEHAGVRIRVDVLERLPGGAWGLREVKSSTSVKPEHLPDLAVQQFVLESEGLRIGSAELLHVNNRYVRGEDGIDWSQLFVRAECSVELEPHLRAVSENVRRLHGVVGQGDAPAVEPGPHCRAPHVCEFWEHCTREKPADWIYHLPRLSRRAYAELSAAGHERISELPADTLLNERQRRIRDALGAGAASISPALADALRGAGPPAWYLDFETAGPAVPLFAATRPYQVLPFQWSLHRLEADGSVGHQAFLADGSADPRRAFCESLLSALPADGAPVHVYSSFEATQLVALARDLPEFAPGLDALRARLFDLLRVVQAHVYHPGFDFSFSIKRVAPALAPGFGWDDLDGIAAGSVAAAAWPQLVRGALAGEEADALKRALLAYCARDTLAMLELHRALREL